VVSSLAMRASGRYALRVLAATYLVGLWLDGIGCEIPSRALPRPAEYFMQVAALFPDAATAASEYRAEGWICADQRWQELDSRPYFPLDPDDKENRFQRALRFYRDEPLVLHALDDYLVERHNAGLHDDGIPRDRVIGGARIVLVRVPIPRPGTPIERLARRPLADFAKDETRVLYHTPKARLDQRCGPTVVPVEETP
jgi:hypothetical protein